MPDLFLAKTEGGEAGDKMPVLCDATGKLIVTGGSGSSATQIQGTAADGAAAAGNPVQTGGKDTDGNAQTFATDPSGRMLNAEMRNVVSAALTANGQTSEIDASGATMIMAAVTVGGGGRYIWEFSYDGTTWVSYLPVTFDAALGYSPVFFSAGDVGINRTLISQNLGYARTRIRQTAAGTVTVTQAAWSGASLSPSPASMTGLNLFTEGVPYSPVCPIIPGDISLSRPLWTLQGVFDGAGYQRARMATVFKNLSAVAVGTETTIWTPASGKKFRLMGFCLSQGVLTGAVTLRDNTAGTTILVIPANTVGVVINSPNMGLGILSAAANNVLTAQGVATETLTGFVFGTEE